MFQCIFFFSQVFFCFLFSFEALYLTYPEDPTRSIAIHWIEVEGMESPSLFYQEQFSNVWVEEKAKTSILENYQLHQVVLYGLKAGTEYVFRLKEREYRFSTLSTDKSLYIAIGGDAYSKSSSCQAMNKQVAKRSPDFVVLGGDIAYANQKKDPLKRWIAFFSLWHETMRSQDGQLIPLIGLVGNHDVQNKKGGKDSFFCDFFP